MMTLLIMPGAGDVFNIEFQFFTVDYSWSVFNAYFTVLSQVAQW